ncbi:DHA2 family efflux MFS transporter permease subunit [Nocardioides sp. zg-536]|uniref:DHA2 family efflux MFS transporter permease subunit n=1 Tax=Nocardioides faecalis TaxID=2803858 RepID=A0A938Y826_9ACTN|nr:DHA2 family efflux MFS transporter permease subunit [Nocardioides faecalis]MBM9460912.1 DHA2 family efflux MFS transporter permease subunit [Nocardioides faecalis]MBS4751887.1 DHA2 family efflux MFS transporter permease subunit [Nocardioides faecalis]QVI59263.1 DHA2 family efflux MFS transporter permease subunit [Nocardioides faecalis]
MSEPAVPARPAEPDYPDHIDGAVLKVALVVVLGAIMSILDITVVSVALPTFAEEFDSSLATVAWTMTAYTLALATVIPATGWAADRFGTKRIYLVALALFTAGSVLCALADSITMLIVFRVLQGLGGGMLMPLGMAMMTRAAGPKRMGRLMAILGVPMLLGPISGPILGGWLIDIASWHWIFLINLPLGAIAIAASAKILPKDDPHPSERFDLIGMLLLSPGLALLLFGVSSIAESGEGASFGPRVWASASAGVVLIVAFVLYSFKPKHPLVDLRLFRNRRLTLATITMFLFMVAFMGAGLLFPSYYLQVRGESTLTAGLLVAPQGLGAMLMMPIAGVLADKIPIGRTAPFGLVAMALGLVGFMQLEADTSYWVLSAALFLMGLGQGLTMMPIMTSALKSLTHAEAARGSTLVNIIQQVGGSVGTAVLSVVLTAQLGKSKDVPLPDGETVTEAELAIAATMQPGLAETLGLPRDLIDRGLDAAAGAFGNTFGIAVVLVLLTLVPVAFLPRKREDDAASDPDEDVMPVLLH